MSEQAQVIHKLVSTSPLGNSEVFQLCNPDINFKVPTTDPNYVKWAETAKGLWKFVTCPDCLSRKLG